MTTARNGILHIGLPKTGTTTIQNAFHHCRNALLAEDGILYPSLEANHTTPLCTMFLDDPTAHITNKLAGLTSPEDVARKVKGYFEAFESEILSRDWRTLLFSAEGLSNLSAGEVRKLKTWVSRFTPAWRVIAWVRHPVDMTRSVMQQLVKGGYTLDEMTEKPVLPNFRGKLNNWLGAFGRENIEIVPFESAVAGPGGIAGAFARSVGIEGGMADAIVQAAGRENLSMSHEAVHLLSSLNRQRPLLAGGGIAPQRTGNELHIIQKIPGRRFELDPATARRIKAESRPDVEWLNATFGLSLYGDIFDDTAPQAEAGQSQLWNRETIDHLAILLSDLLNKTYFQNEMSKGNQALKQNDLATALAHYAEASRVLPDSAAARAQIEAVRHRQAQKERSATQSRSG